MILSLPRGALWRWSYPQPSSPDPKERKGRSASWAKFSTQLPDSTIGAHVILHTLVSDLLEYVRNSSMVKQMRRLHFMFRPPEGSVGPAPQKATTWSGEQDERDMILRGPQEGDHYLPERRYRPWPEAVVRDFKADGVYWNVRIC